MPKRERICRVGRSLAALTDADRRFRLATAERLGLAASDFDALILLDTSGPLTAGKMAEAMGVTTGAVTGLIDRLARAGYVERTRHETDRRQVVIEVAEQRRAELDAHWSERERLIGDALGDLDDAALAAEGRRFDALTIRMLAGLAERAAAAEEVGAEETGIERAPRGSIEHGTLRFASGVSHIQLSGARLKDLYRATFDGKRPQITVEPDGLVTLQYKGFSWFGMVGVSARIALTTAVPWAIEIRRGASHLTADLRDLEVTSIEITGGASECELTLPAPRGLATLRITGGASRMSVRRPRGTAAQVSVRGGASTFVFDDQRLGSVGSALRLSTPSWDTSPDRWSIEVTGGASTLSVNET